MLHNSSFDLSATNGKTSCFANSKSIVVKRTFNIVCSSFNPKVSIFRDFNEKSLGGGSYAHIINEASNLTNPANCGLLRPHQGTKKPVNQTPVLIYGGGQDPIGFKIFEYLYIPDTYKKIKLKLV